MIGTLCSNKEQGIKNKELLEYFIQESQHIVFPTRVSVWCELDPNTRKHTKIGFTNLMWGDYNVAVLIEIKQIYTQGLSLRVNLQKRHP
jgi:hypothetical protein